MSKRVYYLNEITGKICNNNIRPGTLYMKQASGLKLLVGTVVLFHANLLIYVIITTNYLKIGGFILINN